MRYLAWVFIALIAALQYPMWLGKGGWLQVREYDRQVALQRDANAGRWANLWLSWREARNLARESR